MKFVRHFINKYARVEEAVSMKISHTKYKPLIKSLEDENVYAMYQEALSGKKSNRLLEFDHTASG